MSPRFTRQHMSISIGVAHDRITGVVRRGRVARAHTVPVELNGTGEDLTAMKDAFERLRVQLDDSDAASATAVSVAILPPLADSRLITLPPLRPAESQSILRRDSGRYFVGIQAPHITAVNSTSHAPRAGTAGPVLAAAANAAFVDAIGTAAAAAGWHVHSIAPAHAAWTAAATGSSRGDSRAAMEAYVAVTAGTAHIVRLSGRRAEAIRRVPLSAHQDVVAAAAGERAAAASAGARVVIYADGDVREHLAGRFSAAGWNVADSDMDAVAAAAQFCSQAGVRFVSATLAAERRTREKRLAVRLLVAAAILIIVAASVEMWGARRERDAIRARRAEIRAQVGPLLAVRDSIDVMLQQAAEIDARARGIPRWTPALFDLALMLPAESHLTSLSARGDTIIIEAQGAGAGTALQALRSAGTLRDARLIGTVERELDGGATSIERFRISARLAQPPADPVVAGNDEQESLR